MGNEEIIKEYESESGKKAIVGGKETIGFKRWKKQQHKSPSKLEDIIPTFRSNFRKDIKDIIKIYLKKANIRHIQKNILEYLKAYIESVFPSRVIYKSRLYKIDSAGVLDLKQQDIKDLQNVEGLFKLYALEHLKLNINLLDRFLRRLENL